MLSPQSPKPFPLNWLESKGVMAATSTGWLNDTPPSVDFAAYTASCVECWCAISRHVRYTVPSGPTARSANCSSPEPCVIRYGRENVAPWSVERENRMALLADCPG